MYMAADYWREHGVLGKSDIQYWSGAAKLFAVAKYENTLLQVCKKADIKLHFMEKLVEIDGPNKRAKFIGIGEGNKDVENWVEFDMIHVTPPQSAPDFIKQSPLANAAGWVDVDKNNLQHVRYANVFGIGDAASLPTSKTGAAIRKQAPVVVENLLAALAQQPMTGEYTGYTSCPLVTGYGKLVLAEFDYNNQPMETFPFDQFSFGNSHSRQFRIDITDFYRTETGGTTQIAVLWYCCCLVNKTNMGATIVQF
jgi:sulfide:quinone oxidoreductase